MINDNTTAINNKVLEEGDWLKESDNELFSRLDRETDPNTARRIMETIAGSHYLPYRNNTGQTKIMLDYHIRNRILSSPCPALQTYRARLKKWNIPPELQTPTPEDEWAMEAFAEKIGLKLEDEQVLREEGWYDDNDDD